VDRSLLAGWSYGAVVAAHWASLNPDRDPQSDVEYDAQDA
jgi:pimeloyl-ACP methyl ester carboxylesterase